MFEKIMFPCDFSEACKKSNRFIKQLKEAGAKEVIVLHVIDDRLINSIKNRTTSRIDVEELGTVMEKDAQIKISEVEAEFKKSGFNVKTIIKKGIPFREILEAEQELDISLVVIGSHGTSCIKEMLLGSVSEKVIRKSSKHVLVVRR